MNASFLLPSGITPLRVLLRFQVRESLRSREVTCCFSAKVQPSRSSFSLLPPFRPIPLPQNTVDAMHLRCVLERVRTFIPSDTDMNWRKREFLLILVGMHDNLLRLLCSSACIVSERSDYKEWVRRGMRLAR